MNPTGSFVDYVCDTNSNPIGFRKTTGDLNNFNYDLKIFEERYNVIKIVGGKVGLMMAN